MREMIERDVIEARVGKFTKTVLKICKRLSQMETPIDEMLQRFKFSEVLSYLVKYVVLLYKAQLVQEVDIYDYFNTYFFKLVQHAAPEGMDDLLKAVRIIEASEDEKEEER